MALLQLQLKFNILDVYIRSLKGQIQISNPPDPIPPGMCHELAKEMANAYDSYAKVAMAGALTSIVTPGLTAALEQYLTQPNYSGWAIGWALYWAPVTFAGGGFIPVNPINPLDITSGLVGMTTDIKNYIDISNAPNSLEESADRLATILHSWTTKLNVIATTTSAPPVVSMLPVS